MTVHADHKQTMDNILWLFLVAGQLTLLTSTCKIRRRVCYIKRSRMIKVEGILVPMAAAAAAAGSCSRGLEKHRAQQLRMVP